MGRDLNTETVVAVLIGSEIMHIVPGTFALRPAESFDLLAHCDSECEIFELVDFVTNGKLVVMRRDRINGYLFDL